MTNRKRADKLISRICGAAACATGYAQRVWWLVGISSFVLLTSFAGLLEAIFGLSRADGLKNKQRKGA